jgi:hypothetical protein
MFRAAWALLRDSAPDLLDRSNNRLAGPALRQAIRVLPVEFRPAAFRSRGTSRAFTLEVAVGTFRRFSGL